MENAMKKIGEKIIPFALTVGAVVVGGILLHKWIVPKLDSMSEEAAPPVPAKKAKKSAEGDE